MNLKKSILFHFPCIFMLYQKFTNRINLNLFFIFLFFLIISLIPQLYLFEHIIEDANIHNRYIDRFFMGKGLTFNDGEFVEGFSNPLWLIVLIIIKTILLSIKDLEIDLISKYIGFAFFILMYLTCLFISKKIFLKDDVILGYTIICLFIFFTPSFHVYSSSGMGTIMFCFLILFSFNFFLSNIYLKKYFYTALILSLIGITRPEGVLYPFFWYIFVFYNDFYKNKILNIRNLIIILFILVIPFTIYEIFRINYYGGYLSNTIDHPLNKLLPNTFFIKTPGQFGGLFGLGYLLPWFISLISFISIFLLSFLLIPEKFNKFFKTTNSSKLIYSIIIFLLPNLIFIFYVQGDWMFFGRHFIPVWTLLIIFSSYFVVSFVFKNISINHYRNISKVILSIIFISNILFPWAKDIQLYLNDISWTNFMKGHDQEKVGIWINDNFNDKITIATGRIGGVSFKAQNHVVWDLIGLTDKEQAIYNFKNKNDKDFDFFNNSPISKREIDMLGITSNKYSEYLITYIKKNNYKCIKVFTQGKIGTFDIWVKKSLTNMPQNCHPSIANYYKSL